MLRGVNLLANAVSVTLGPKGACGRRSTAAGHALTRRLQAAT
jgi:hypothetical protein